MRAQPSGHGPGHPADVEEYDVVVIGSGFGGAVTACRAAQAGHRVLVLERGRPYPPGSFPRTPLEMSTNVWDPSEGLFGLFQIWSFARLDAIVSSGLGGGSLIYANVVTPIPAQWFELHARQWPLAYADLDEHYATVHDELSVQDFPIDRYGRLVPKAEFLRQAAQARGLPYRPAPLAVAFAKDGQNPGEEVQTGEQNLHRVVRRTCRLCGQCDVGCNDGSKNSLDLTYLSRARNASERADIRTLHEVRQITDTGDGYLVGYVRHEPVEPAWQATPRPPGRHPRIRIVRAPVVVVSAGALGTTRLLLANRPGLPRLSPCLGSRFTGNGDAIGLLTGNETAVVESSRGPVITGMVRFEAGGERFLIEDGGEPSMLGWLGEALSPALYGRVAALALARAWERTRRLPKSNLGRNVHRALRSATVSRSTLPLLAMGVDSSTRTLLLRDGRLELGQEEGDPGRTRAYFRAVTDGMRLIAATSGSRYRRNPSQWLSGNVTAHPLGGAPMGRDRLHGVVDSHGEVFGHRGLFVADGSVMPAPIGANPSMTIAALAERFAVRINERIVQRCP